MLLSLLLASAAVAAPSARIVQIAPADKSFAYSASAEEASLCTVSTAKPLKAVVLGESETHFEVQWLTPIGGCYLPRYFGSLSKHHGFVRKADITWDDENADDMPVVASLEEEGAPSAPAPCPPEKVPGAIADVPAAAPGGLFENIGKMLEAVKHRQAGIKPPEHIDKYMECYPYGADGLANYRRYKKFLGLAADTFRVTIKGQPIDVNPTLVACLFRRESGYDPKNGSHTGAVGLGQHTSINIKEISRRISQKGSWEATLWKNFFARAKADPEGRKLLAECRGSTKGEPVFNSAADAMCPLQSIAASHIYNLAVQRELMKSSKMNHIEWENELDYQLGIGATYNLGDGAASSAVKDLFVGGWAKAITRKSKDKEKQKEVANHVTALRNCMAAGNWQPMAAGDKPVCENFPGSAGSAKALRQKR